MVPHRIRPAAYFRGRTYRRVSDLQGRDSRWTRSLVVYEQRSAPYGKIVFHIWQFLHWVWTIRFRTIHFGGISGVVLRSVSIAVLGRSDNTRLVPLRPATCLPGAFMALFRRNPDRHVIADCRDCVCGALANISFCTLKILRHSQSLLLAGLSKRRPLASGHSRGLWRHRQEVLDGLEKRR